MFANLLRPIWCIGDIHFIIEHVGLSVLLQGVIRVALCRLLRNDFLFFSKLRMPLSLFSKRLMLAKKRGEEAISD